MKAKTLRRTLNFKKNQVKYATVAVPIPHKKYSHHRLVTINGAKPDDNIIYVKDCFMSELFWNYVGGLSRATTDEKYQSEIHRTHLLEWMERFNDDDEVYVKTYDEKLLKVVGVSKTINSRTCLCLDVEEPKD